MELSVHGEIVEHGAANDDERKVLELKKFLFGRGLTSLYVDTRDAEYAKRHVEQWAEEAVNDVRTKYSLARSISSVYDICKREDKVEQLLTIFLFKEFLERNGIRMKDGDKIVVTINKFPIHETARLLLVSERNISADGLDLNGKNGKISCVDDSMIIDLKAPSIRQFSAWKKKLSFMQLVKYSYDEGTFSLGRKPTAEEAGIIRKIVGFKKTPKTG
jgi:hypothetical protein